MTAKKKGGGGKLSRSEVVTIRLDPKLRFAAELAARKQRRTLSSFVEWAIEKAVSEEVVKVRSLDGNGDTALEAMTRIWDVEEADRFVKFAEEYRDLLNFDEERLWKLIKETPYFFKKVEQKLDPNKHLSWSANSNNIWFKRIRNNWELLHKIVAGEETQDALPKLPNDEIYNNDVPF
jgi:hypothetical protein